MRDGTIIAGGDVTVGAAVVSHGGLTQELMKAMRDTVPEGGALEGGAGEEIFTGMLDMHLAGQAATRQQRSIGDALYRQLARLLSTAGPAGTEEK